VLSLTVDRKNDMNEQQIIGNLKLLGEELEALQIQQPVRLLMIGGAFMITQFGNRTVTEDVDVFTRLDRESEEYRLFREAIRWIAQDVHVSQKWVSDTIGDFMELVGPVPAGTLWLKHGMLEIFIPESEYVLALKLLAGRKKDVEDILVLFQQLRIETRAQARALLQAYVSKPMLEDYRAKVGRLLRKLLIQ
jgi:hypothetical protein